MLTFETNIRSRYGTNQAEEGKKMDLSFDERLNFVLKDRKQTPWGKSLGFTGASISHIFSGGRIPGPEFLQAIRRAENVNLNWLLTGEGSPYIVEYFQTADALTEHVRAMLKDETWDVYVCSHEETACIALTQLGAYEFKGKFIDYNIAHILTGPNSDELVYELRNHHYHKRRVFTPLLSENEQSKIITGQLGTYELFTSETALLKPSNIAIFKNEITFTSKEGSSTSIAFPILKEVIRVVGEKEASGIVLTIEQRARIIAAIYRQISRMDLPDPIPEQAFSAAVEAAFDLLID